MAELVAVVDLGSTAVRLVLARIVQPRGWLLDPLGLREGVDVQSLSAREEARLGVDAAVDSLPFTNGIVADLGGASLQLSRARDRRLGPARACRSAPCAPPGASCGTIHRSRASFKPFTATFAKHLVNLVPPSTRGEVIVGLGGIVRTLAKIYLRSERGDRKHRHGLELKHPTSRRSASGWRASPGESAARFAD